MKSSTRDFAPPPSSSHLRARECRDQSHHQNLNNHQEQHQKKQRQHENFGSLISRNSIQNQFSVLSNQRDNFIREKDEAEKELKQVQIDHLYIKKEHDTLAGSNRRAKEELGQKMEKLAMLKEEESRLIRLTENEFHAIHNCTKHSKVLEKKKNDSTKRHTAEIEPLNFELAALLERRILKKTERCITVRSVESVVIPKFDKALLDKNKPQLLNQRKDLYESIELLKLASGQHKKYIALLRQHRGAQQQQRHVKTKESGAASGALELNTNKGQNHDDLFYGRSNND